MSAGVSQVSRLVGVVDLSNGLAVRGVAGQRTQYRPVRSFRFSDGRRVRIDGCHRRLIECYLQAGLRSIYVADLNGIQTGCVQVDPIERILDATDGASSVLLDLGIEHSAYATNWRWITKLAECHANGVFIVASESAQKTRSLGECVNRLGLERIAASCDYLSTRWISQRIPEPDWYEACVELGIRTAIGLDLATVGGVSIDRTIQLCRNIRQQLPETRYLTGGGIRNSDDAQHVLDAGADGLLVASRFVD